jgi:hypothetical protein
VLTSWHDSFQEIKKVVESVDTKNYYIRWESV